MRSTIDRKAGSSVKVGLSSTAIHSLALLRVLVECQRTFCSRHSLTHRHPPQRATPPPTERYDRHVHLDQIAEWERRAIDRIRKQADEARRPLIAPPTPISPTPPSPTLVNESPSEILSRLLSTSSNFEKQVPRDSLAFFTAGDLLGTGDRSFGIVVRRNIGRYHRRSSVHRTTN